MENSDVNQAANQEQKRNHDEQQKKNDRILAAVAENAREQHERNNLAKKEQILTWITSLNFFQRQADIFHTWQQGTGQWLLSDPQFQNWELHAGGILWCKGIPGAGKTVLSSLVVNHLRSKFRQSNTGVACIYLNHKETEIQTSTSLLASLWKQFMVDKSISPAVDYLYKHHWLRDTRPSQDEVFDMLQSAVAEHSRSYFIVDALDEYPEDQRNILLGYLSKLLGATTSLMLTARPHVSLNDFFPDLVGLEIHATDDDIHHYVDNKIRKSAKLSKHVQTRPELRDEIQATLTSNAQGMFLMAKWHTDTLATKNTVKAVREALQHLPTDLNCTYDEAINLILSQNDDDKQLALQALTWVAYAKRPLTVDELREALAIEPNATSLDSDNLLDITIVLSVCAGLIIVDEAMSVVRLIHYTTQGYFDAIQSLKFPDAHTMIASSCLEYLCFSEFLHVRVDHLKHGAVQELLKLHPFIAYSQYCLLHAVEAPTQKDLRTKIEWADVDARGWPDGTALQAACAEGHKRVVQVLLGKGADVNAQGGDDGTALQAASYFDHEPVVRLLLEKGADVNAQGGTYGTALQAASQYSDEPVVQLLLEKGADVNAQGGRYGTALQAAVVYGHKPVVQFLTERGADVNAPGGPYGTVLEAAAVYGHESIVQLLIDKGADVNGQGGEDGMVLWAASLFGHEPVVQILIEKGADVDAQVWPHGTALQAASAWGHEGVVCLLIDSLADVNKQVNDTTALWQASVRGHVGIVQLLLDSGAIITSSGHYGTPLQAAFAWGHESTVQLLIANGAHPPSAPVRPKSVSPYMLSDWENY
ncbi:ankyrin repeat-containing domain protein [Mycena latifolia]|nr:ankyrin repeat-containing domain protein [Mycena latifolia]